MSFRKKFHKSYNINGNSLDTISNFSMGAANLTQFAIKGVDVLLHFDLFLILLKDKEVWNELNEINVSVKNKLKKYF